MRNVVVGAGVALLLGLATGMVGWRWAHPRPRRYATPAARAGLQGNSTTVRSVENQSRIASTNITSYFNSSSANISSIPETARGGSGVVSSVDSSTPPTLADLPTANSTERSTSFGFFNESSALNSSLVQENNDTDVSFDSEDSNRNSSLPTNSTEDDIDYVKMGQELLTEAMTILDTGIWDFERRTEDGDAIFSRQLDNGNMVYRLTGIVDMPPQDLLVIIWDGLPDYPKWNPTLLECRVLEKINDQTDISYTVSAPGARGYVASRDFVSLRHWELRHNTYIAASRSIAFPGAPSNPDYIRGRNGPGCMELRPLSSDPSRTEFRWLLNTKLNGWIPSYIADKAYKKFMTRYMILLREYCRIIKQRATDFTLSSTTLRNITE